MGPQSCWNFIRVSSNLILCTMIWPDTRPTATTSTAGACKKRKNSVSRSCDSFEKRITPSVRQLWQTIIHPATLPHIFTSFILDNCWPFSKLSSTLWISFNLYPKIKIQQMPLQNLFLNQQNLHFIKLQSKINLARNYQCNEASWYKCILKTLWIHDITQWRLHMWWIQNR